MEPESGGGDPAHSEGNSAPEDLAERQAIPGGGNGAVDGERECLDAIFSSILSHQSEGGSRGGSSQGLNRRQRVPPETASGWIKAKRGRKPKEDASSVSAAQMDSMFDNLEQSIRDPRMDAGADMVHSEHMHSDGAHEDPAGDDIHDAPSSPDVRFEESPNDSADDRGSSSAPELPFHSARSTILQEFQHAGIWDRVTGIYVLPEAAPGGHRGTVFFCPDRVVRLDGALESEHVHDWRGAVQDGHHCGFCRVAGEILPWCTCSGEWATQRHLLERPDAGMVAPCDSPKLCVHLAHIMEQARQLISSQLMIAGESDTEATEAEVHKLLLGVCPGVELLDLALLDRKLVSVGPQADIARFWADPSSRCTLYWVDAAAVGKTQTTGVVIDTPKSTRCLSCPGSANLCSHARLARAALAIPNNSRSFCTDDTFDRQMRAVMDDDGANMRLNGRSYRPRSPYSGPHGTADRLRSEGPAGGEYSLQRQAHSLRFRYPLVFPPSSIVPTSCWDANRPFSQTHSPDSLWLSSSLLWALLPLTSHSAPFVCPLERTFDVQVSDPPPPPFPRSGLWRNGTTLDDASPQTPLPASSVPKPHEHVLHLSCDRDSGAESWVHAVVESVNHAIAPPSVLVQVVSDGRHVETNLERLRMTSPPDMSSTSEYTTDKAMVFDRGNVAPHPSTLTPSSTTPRTLNPNRGGPRGKGCFL